MPYALSVCLSTAPGILSQYAGHPQPESNFVSDLQFDVSRVSQLQFRARINIPESATPDAKSNALVQRGTTASTFVNTIVIHLVILASSCWFGTFLSQDMILQQIKHAIAKHVDSRSFTTNRGPREQG